MEGMETRNEQEKTKQGLFEGHEQEKTVKKLNNKDDDEDGGINKKSWILMILMKFLTQ